MTRTEVTGVALSITEAPYKFKKMESQCTSAPGRNARLA